MKAVLISIQPKWCELIASGKKTVEVRKTKPKIETPFKCYIYCTKGEHLWKTKDRVFLDGKYNRLIDDLPDYLLDGKVIGEFVCDGIGTTSWLKSPDHLSWVDGYDEESCLTNRELYEYSKGDLFYEWHISDLVIYDEPKELSEFFTALSDKDIRCEHIQMRYTINGIRYNKCTLQNCVCEFRRLGHQTDCDGYEMLNPSKPITRPPQSWCYVEERSAYERN